MRQRLCRKLPKLLDAIRHLGWMPIVILCLHCITLLLGLPRGVVIGCENLRKSDGPKRNPISKGNKTKQLEVKVQFWLLDGNIC